MSEIKPVDDPPAPEYTSTDPTGLLARLEPLHRKNPKRPIVPVTRYPDPIPDAPKRTHDRSGRRIPQETTTPYDSDLRARKLATRALQADIVTALFAYVSVADTQGIAHLVRDQGLVSPDCPNENGETPLLAAIRARSAPTARTLLSLGADPNLPGTPPAAAWDDDNDGGESERVPKTQSQGRGRAGAGGITPLMLASATGQLAIVKLLFGEFSADDSIVGPRGETALWLAARSGHREVVAYLPTRRAGAWRRLRHSKEAARLRKAVVAAGVVGTCLVYTVPRGLVFDIPRAVGGHLWRRRARVWGLVVRAVRGLPRWLGEVVRYVLTEMPRDVWRAVVWVARAVPRVLGVLWRGVVEGLKKVGGAVAYAAQRVVSVLHSFFVAVVGFLRSVKLRDLGHDLLVAMKALLVKLPGAVLTFVVQLPATIKRAIKACFRSDWVKCLLSIALAFVLVVPRAIWKMLESLWACLGRGVEELISLLNPKMVSSRKSRS